MNVPKPVPYEPYQPGVTPFRFQSNTRSSPADTEMATELRRLFAEIKELREDVARLKQALQLL